MISLMNVIPVQKLHYKLINLLAAKIVQHKCIGIFIRINVNNVYNTVIYAYII